MKLIQKIRERLGDFTTKRSLAFDKIYSAPHGYSNEHACEDYDLAKMVYEYTVYRLMEQIGHSMRKGIEEEIIKERGREINQLQIGDEVIVVNSSIGSITLSIKNSGTQVDETAFAAALHQLGVDAMDLKNAKDSSRRNKMPSKHFNASLDLETNQV